MSEPLYTLVRAAAQPKWSTRPTFVRTQTDLDRLRQVTQAIVDAGFSSPKMLEFKGQPTMDLLVESSEPEETAAALRKALHHFELQVEAVGAHLDLV
jgi:hypothetical protein